MHSYCTNGEITWVHAYILSNIKCTYNTTSLNIIIISIAHALVMIMGDIVMHIFESSLKSIIST
jgi:hypothetical protein